MLVAMGLLAVNERGESRFAPARLDLQSTPAETPRNTTGIRSNVWASWVGGIGFAHGELVW